MKKLFIIALCAATLTGANAQKANVDAAKKMAGKTEKITEARKAIQQAMQDPSTATAPNTYIVAADVEYKAYDSEKKKLGINATDASAEQKMVMDSYLLEAYPQVLNIIKYSDNDPKGKALQEAVKRFEKYAQNYYTAGANFYGAEKYYPEAYNAFMYFGDIATNPIMVGHLNIPDSVAATSYYYAGLAGWSGKELEKATVAFANARKNGISDPQSFIYELATWQNLMQSDSTIVTKAQNAIFELSKAGFQKFGMDKPIFLSNMVSVLIDQNKGAEALNELNAIIATNPSSFILGLRGFVNDRMGNEEASVNDYRTAANDPNADFETLVNAAKKIFRSGTEKWNAIDATQANASELRKQIRNDYFIASKSIVDIAKAKAPEGDTSLDYLMEQLEYALNSLR